MARNGRHADVTGQHERGGATRLVHEPMGAGCMVAVRGVAAGHTRRDVLYATIGATNSATIGATMGATTRAVVRMRMDVSVAVRVKLSMRVIVRVRIRIRGDSDGDGMLHGMQLRQPRERRAQDQAQQHQRQHAGAQERWNPDGMTPHPDEPTRRTRPGSSPRPGYRARGSTVCALGCAAHALHTPASAAIGAATHAVIDEIPTTGPGATMDAWHGIKAVHLPTEIA